MKQRWASGWKARGGTLHVVVKLLNKQTGDVLSLQRNSGDIIPRWDAASGELSLDVASGTTAADIRTALRTLWLDTKVSASSSIRKVWVFPILSGVDDFRYRTDETEGLVRYYLHDGTSRLFSDASTEAAESSLFGRDGYLGVHTSDAERNVYLYFGTGAIHLGVSDSVEEGKWVIASGPGKGRILWDHNVGSYGSGASGSGWLAQGDFWLRGKPDGLNSKNYASLDSYGYVSDAIDQPRYSVRHHDLWLSDEGFVARRVDVRESPSNPVLQVGFHKLQVTSHRPLREEHISVDDVRTRLDDGSEVDATRISLRITGLARGVLHRRASNTSSVWKEVQLTGSSPDAYREFTLADLRGGLISLHASPGVSTLVFSIQAVDGDRELSDSDPKLHGDQATSVSVPILALKEIEAGKEMPVNGAATSGDGALTPNDTTLDAWVRAARSNPLRVLVELEGGRRGDALFLKDGHGIGTIASSWSWDKDANIGILSLQGDGAVTVDHFQAVLNALSLRTVRLSDAGVRTISLRPDVRGGVEKKDYYTRDVLVRASSTRPYVGMQQLLHLKFGRDDRAVLLPSEFFVEDFDTSASHITIFMRNLTPGAKLQKKDVLGVYQDIGDGSFRLEDMHGELIAIYLSRPLGKKVAFDLEARDDGGQWSDVGEGNVYRRGVRSFALDAVLGLAPHELETDLETGYQKAIPFGGLAEMIQAVRSRSGRTGAVHILLENAVSGDRLVMHESVSGVSGAWSDGGHRYVLTVSDGSTTSAQIDAALAQVHYRARESGERRNGVLLCLGR